MINYNTYSNSTQSMMPMAQVNQYPFYGMDSPPVFLASNTQPYIPLYGMSIMDRKYEKMLGKIYAAYEKSRNKESAEYLDADAYYKDTRLFTTDDSGQRIRGRPFMNASIADVKGYIAKERELGAIVTIQLTTTGEQRTVKIEPEEWGSTKLADLIEGPGISIVAKISKERKRNLLASYIKRLMTLDSIIAPRDSVQWCKEANRLFYADGLKSTLIDAKDMKSKVIWNTDNWSNYGEKLEMLVRMMTSFKDPGYAALATMSCAGGFLKSILLRSEWKPEAVLCFCGNGVDVMSVLGGFVSFWKSMPARIIKAEQSEKNFRIEVRNTGDELMVIDCGHEIKASYYQENQRKSNIQSIANWGDYGFESFPIAISNDVYDICTMEDYLIPIMVDNNDIQWEIWKNFRMQKAGLAEMILLLKNYVEATGEIFQEHIANIMIQKYAEAQNEQVKFPGVIAVYQTIKEVLLSMIQYHAIDNQWSDLFLAACEQALSLIDLYAEIPAKEFIEERFLVCMDMLVDNRKLIFADVKANINDQDGRPIIFYKDEYLYMEIIDFKEIVLKEMGISDKNITRVLSVLKEAEYLCTYRGGKDFYVDVTIGSSRKRRSMIRFNYKKFQRMGEADIVMRGEHINEE